VGDPRLEGRSVYDEDVPKKKKTGGHAKARTYFTNQARVLYQIEDVNLGLLNTAIKALKVKHGLDYDQIVEFMHYWFNRKDAEIRRALASRQPLSLSQWFANAPKEQFVTLFERERLQANKKTNTALGAPSIREKMGW
jgi:hypothetical protein